MATQTSSKNDSVDRVLCPRAVGLFTPHWPASVTDSTSVASDDASSRLDERMERMKEKRMERKARQRAHKKSRKAKEREEEAALQALAGATQRSNEPADFTWEQQQQSTEVLYISPPPPRQGAEAPWGEVRSWPSTFPAPMYVTPSQVYTSRVYTL
eukprot:TRINITY_DN17301_c0_g1_i1.p1 TRINITY_DN17301_c0_g1~~TRINITY_DN17301_c0_g1_i1.p1  ORF type:complete len:156 (+),score=26.71 TRINITY_DN17301_c0_g1_i1:75-542(+)